MSNDESSRARKLWYRSCGLMIRHPELVEDFERRYVDEHRLDYARAVALYEAMFEHARRLGVLPSRDPLDGIETDIELARMLNVRRPA